jgi:hypothetical protein
MPAWDGHASQKRGGTHENDWRLFRSFARSKHVQTLQSIQETIPFQGQTDCLLVISTLLLPFLNRCR